MNETPKIEWRIEEGKVGPVELGKAIPAVLLAPDLEAHYVARHIADAVPMDAFRFDDPPLTLVLAAGPFAEASAVGDPSGQPPTDRLRGKAAEVARGGVAVKAIMVHGAGPRTATGLGVGSTFEDIQAAYADAKLTGRPETLGGDGCVAKSKSLPGVVFVFASCAKAKQGDPVARVDLWP
jgi:hypothetical protein